MGELTAHHYRHLPVVDGRPADRRGVAPRLMGWPAYARGREQDRRAAGLEGVVVAETTVGDVRGQEGFFQYRQYSAVDWPSSAPSKTYGTSSSTGSFPMPPARLRSPRGAGPPQTCPPARRAPPRPGRPGHSARRAAQRRLGPRQRSSAGARRTTSSARSSTTRPSALCAVVPTILASAYRLAEGLDPVQPRADLDFAANYLCMLTGEVPSAAHARAIEQYMILDHRSRLQRLDVHGRVITSTGADLAAAIVGAIGALSGPLHGAHQPRPRHARRHRHPDRAEAYIRRAVEDGERIMGFGHRVYKTTTPARSCCGR